MIHNVLYYRNYPRRNRIIAAYIILFPLAGVICYLIFSIDKDYCALFTSALVLYFTSLYIHVSNIDPLTSLLNRQSFYQDMKDKNSSGVVSVDMNDLKYWNDNAGHGAGDEALKTVSAVLRDGCGAGGRVYRVGGDEFIILYKNATEKDIVNAISAMREKMKATPYVCAFGYAIREENADIAGIIRASDKKLYENKKELKLKI